MKRLEFSGAVRLIYRSLGVKWLSDLVLSPCCDFILRLGDET